MGAVYAPGLNGPFILDDESNLRPLGAQGPIDSAQDLGRFVFSGTTSPLGRPLTLLTFAANAQDWPTDPWWFKLTNVGIHLANGVLVFALAWLLALPVTRDRTVAGWVATATAALWLLHPIQISSVLYVSQRMNLLASLFVFGALIAYLRGRAVGTTKPGRGLWLQSLAVVAGGMLAMLSKETGALLLLFIVVLEFTLLHRRMGLARPEYWRWWSAVFVWLPLVVLSVYVVSSWQHFYFDYEHRAFTLGEKALTQPRVLLDYLGFVFAPFSHAVDLFNDDFTASRGWLHPNSTVPAMAAVLALIGTGVWLRARQPVLAFAILWFFAGHILEASLIGLEQTYQYRNYVPLLGPAFAVAWYALGWPRAQRRPAGAVLLVVLCLGLGYQTLGEARLWGDKLALAQSWAQRHPTSNRAQHYLAKVYVEENAFDRAYAALQQAELRMPDDVSIELALLYLRCVHHAVANKDIKEVYEDAAQLVYHNSVYGKLWLLEQQVRQKRCPLLDRTALLKILRILIENPYYRTATAQARLLYQQAIVLSEIPRTDAAVVAADKSFAVRANPTVAYNAARWLLQSGQPERALQHIQMAEHAARPHTWVDRWFTDPASRAKRQRIYRELEAKAKSKIGSGG